MTQPSRTAIYALTSIGLDSALRLADGLAEEGLEVRVFASEKLAGSGVTGFAKLAPSVSANWAEFGAHVFFCAAGIVVRTIAPLIEAKDADPAVLCLDQRGQFAISLLSGHLGGANDLAKRAAAILGGKAVITTATDTEKLPSLEMEAQKLGLKVENLSALAGLSSALLEGEAVPVFDPLAALLPVLDWEWPGKFLAVDSLDDLEPGRPAAVVDYHTLADSDSDPDPAWLLLRPPCLTAGLGCNRGTEAREILDFIELVFRRNHLAPASLIKLASVDAKADEAGLLEAAEELGLAIEFFDRARLAEIDTPNPSAMVEKHLGVKSVCEAAALLAVGKGELIIEKNKQGNVTLAVARTR